jgi:hypothetical protein
VEPDEVVEPEVVVRSIRRRRTQPPLPSTPPPVNVRNWAVYSFLTLGLAWLMFEGFLSDRQDMLTLPSLSQATEVRSAVAESGESLQVVVGWDLTLSDPAGAPDSVRVRVVPELGNTVVLTQPATQLTDTAYLPAPAAGETAKGLSCVAARHGEEPVVEVCTPWQYVRPSVTAMAPPMAAPATSQIVIQPSGLQVDPDIGGRCAEWQRTHHPDSVWIRVNRTAVPECTGPNRKPTVAQFCAFAVLADGRRIKTLNSINNRYCEELFAEWIRERYS